MAAAAALAKVHQALQWIGFGNQAHRDSICEEAGFELLKDFVGLSKKDIREIADGYEKRTQAQGCIPFGLQCVNQTPYWSDALGPRSRSLLQECLHRWHSRCQ